MKVIDLSFQHIEKNLSYDDELLMSAEKGHSSEVLRLWESPSFFVVLGRTCQEQQDVFLTECQQKKIPILRRSSGGGTVLQGPGCLNFSLILSKESRPALEHITESYRIILEKVQQSLKGVNIQSEFKPICDLVWTHNGKKFSGNAQKRGRKYILHHGTILYNFDLSLIASCLKMPPKMPEYRQQRSHLDFMTNIPVPCVVLKQALTQEFMRY